MILGRGTIASIIPDRGDDFIFFACGESNRVPFTQERAYAEVSNLNSCNRAKMLVYISGLNIYYPDGGRSEYTKHKLEMEKLVKTYFDNHCIFRLGSVTWGDNPNTIVNYIREQVNLNPDFKGNEVHRYLHTKEELIHWFGLIPSKGKHEMNITGKLTWVPDLVEQIKKGLI